MSKNTTYHIPHTTYQSGQMVLIVVLVMVVALTIGLSMVARTTTDIKISRQQEESARAFSAAEAGIEELLKTGAGNFASATLESGAKFSANVTTAEGADHFTFPEKILAGESQTLWLANHLEADGSLDETPFYKADTLNLCWEETNPKTALEVAVFYKDGSDYKVARGAYDPDGGRQTLNNFGSTDSGSCLGFSNKKTLNFRTDFGVNPVSKTLLFLRIRPYYNSAKVGVEAASGAVFPSQGKEIISTGTLGEISRKVRILHSWPAPPAIFDYVLFSGGDL